MESIIHAVLEELNSFFMELFQMNQYLSIDVAEKSIGGKFSEVSMKLLRAYYEEHDRKLLEDKAWRREAGLRVERKKDKREILTTLGQLEYERTYYRKASGGYEYPTDQIAGVQSYERVSRRVGLSLVDASLEMSYGKSSQYVTGAQISRQTVMNKIRSAYPRQEPVEYRAVRELHVDADEDHANLQNGKNKAVPLVSVYDGVERRGKRGVCKNVFHVSECRKGPSELWEQVSDEIERRYDLSDAKIYLHGDGASWIREGLEYLPNCVFVLDRYHKNKAIKQALSGIARDVASQYEYQIRKALDEENKARLRRIRDVLLQRFPGRKKTIEDNLDYLLTNFEAITVTKHDKAALNGGCTEPHVSHTLSARLSSRPMGWSEKTLEHFLPILAAGGATFEKPGEDKAPLPTAFKFLKADQKKPFLPNTLGLADPDNAVHFPARDYKVTGLFNALRPF